MERPLLALIAHDGQKAQMIAFAMKHQKHLARFRLIATGTTGHLLQQRAGLEVERYQSGPYGGDVQIASRVVEGEVAAVFFFVDELDKHPHDPDIRTLQRACNVHNIPVATNPATAEMVLTSEHVARRFVEEA